MLDKRACRKYFYPRTVMNDTGLLHAEQAGFIIRSTVKMIDHHRVLVLYVHDRAEAEQGCTAPRWTVFQTKAEYITLERKDDDILRWRAAAFEHLCGEWNFVTKCALYSAQDGQRITRYFSDSRNVGLAALVQAQRNIQANRARERRQQQEKKICDRMKCVHALPRSLDSWIRKSVMPAYLMCEHTAAHKPVAGVCTACGHEVTLPGVSHNSKTVCPHCHKELTVKSLAKMGYIFDRDTVQVIQRTGPQELVIRIVKAEYSYNGTKADPFVYENARFFVGLSEQGSFYTKCYFLSYGDGGKTKWLSGCRPRFSPYQYSFAADTCGHVYCHNLRKELASTPWQYCPIEPFYKHFRTPMELPCFLREHLEHSRLEHLIKTGFYRLASDIVYRYNTSGITLDETQNRTHRVLGVAAEDVDFLRELDVSRDELKRFQELATVKDRQPLFRWMKERGITRDAPAVLEYVTAHRLMRYVDEQTPVGRKTQDTLSEYRDYLEMCAQLNYSTGSKSVLFPKDLSAAHDRTAKQVKILADKLMRRNFKAAMERIMGQLDYCCDGLTVMLPTSPEELSAEGIALHHCVGSYADRVARQECIIVFIRHEDDVSTPFYTAEVRNGKIVQLRGLQNCAPTPEVQTFADAWQRDVLQAAAMPSAA